MVLKGHLGINVTPKITRSSDSFNTVPQIVNGRDWVCTVSDLETIIVFCLLAFNLIPQRSHHSLTLPRSRIRNSATVILTLGDGQQPSKLGHQHNRSAYFPEWKKVPKCTRRKLMGQKHCPVALLTQRLPVYSDNHPP